MGSCRPRIGSLLAVRLIARLEEALDRPLSVNALLQGPTIEQLAAALRDDRGGALPAGLVEIRPDGERPPLFCVHPVGGGVLSYAALARALDDSYPMYGLEARRREGESEPLDRIEPMAERYLEAIRAVQPSGPYLLAGWSMGGNVAFEMARLLEAAGEEVAMLAMFDSVPPGTLPPDVADQDEMDLLRAFATDLARSHGAVPRLDLAPPDELTPDSEIDYLIACARLGEDVPALDRETLRERLAVFRANARAEAGQQPLSYGGRALLIRAEDTAATFDVDLEAGWAALVEGGLDVHELKGDHYSIVREPTVHELAARLEAALAEALDRAAAL